MIIYFLFKVVQIDFLNILIYSIISSAILDSIWRRLFVFQKIAMLEAFRITIGKQMFLDYIDPAEFENPCCHFEKSTGSPLFKMASNSLPVNYTQHIFASR